MQVRPCCLHSLPLVMREHSDWQRSSRLNLTTSGLFFATASPNQPPIRCVRWCVAQLIMSPVRSCATLQVFRLDFSEYYASK
jgi:hypothetical protein